MSGAKLSSRQQAQLEFLQTVPPKLQRFHKAIEQMAALQADEAAVRSFVRALEELKAGAQALSLTGMAETAGLMATMARRGGGLQMKVRGLREFLGSLKLKYDGALRQATTPEAAPEPPGPAAT
jgi:chemotaxis protein histidine kinase CheA